MTDEMTAAQRGAIEKAYELLGEHFDSALIAVNYEKVDEDGDNCECHEAYWKGGALTAIGLAEYVKDRVLRRGIVRSEPGA